jgi:hypothetical protein
MKTYVNHMLDICAFFTRREMGEDVNLVECLGLALRPLLWPTLLTHSFCVGVRGGEVRGEKVEVERVMCALGKRVQLAFEGRQ